MIEQNKCPKCKYIYEITWDDDTSEYYNTEDSEFNIELEDLVPCFCPFCGVHRDYGTEEDSSEYIWD